MRRTLPVWRAATHSFQANISISNSNNSSSNSPSPHCARSEQIQSPISSYEWIVQLANTIPSTTLSASVSLARLFRVLIQSRMPAHRWASRVAVLRWLVWRLTFDVNQFKSIRQSSQRTYQTAQILPDLPSAADEMLVEHQIFDFFTEISRHLVFM